MTTLHRRSTTAFKLVAGLALALSSGCLFVGPPPEDLTYTCTQDLDCPQPGGTCVNNTCRTASEQVVSIQSATLDPEVVRDGQQLELSLNVEGELMSPPAVRLASGAADRPFTLVEEPLAGGTPLYGYRLMINDDVDIEGQRPILVDLDPVAGRELENVVATFVLLDFTAPRFDIEPMIAEELTNDPAGQQLTLSYLEEVSELPIVVSRSAGPDGVFGSFDDVESTWLAEGAAMFGADAIPAGTTLVYRAEAPEILPEGLHLFEIEATDPAGNVASVVNEAPFTLDTTPPLVTETPLVTVLPLPGALINAPQQLGPDSRATVSMVFDDVISLVEPVSVDCDNATFLVTPITTNPLAVDVLPEMIMPDTEETCDVVVTVSDLAGNTLQAAAVAQVQVDSRPPVVTAVDLELLRHLRMPWGESAAVPTPRQRVVGLAGDGVSPEDDFLPAEAFVGLEAVGAVRAYLGPNDGDPLIGSSFAQEDGSLPAIDVFAADLPAIWISVIDVTGNESARVQLPIVEWVATLGNKEVASTVGNPHRFLGSPVAVAGPDATSTGEIAAPPPAGTANTLGAVTLRKVPPVDEGPAPPTAVMWDPYIASTLAFDAEGVGHGLDTADWFEVGSLPFFFDVFRAGAAHHPLEGTTWLAKDTTRYRITGPFPEAAEQLNGIQFIVERNGLWFDAGIGRMRGLFRNDNVEPWVFVVGEHDPTIDPFAEQFQELPIAGAPPYRAGATVAASASGHQLLVFGGATNQGSVIPRPAGDNPALGDTWVFEDNAWTEVTTPGPPPRSLATAAWDPMRNGFVLIGGIDEAPELCADAMLPCALRDTWLLSEGAWTNLGITEGIAPLPDVVLGDVDPAPNNEENYFASLVYDATQGGLFLVGIAPVGDGTFERSEWMLREGAWRRKLREPEPGPVAPLGIFNGPYDAGHVAVGDVTRQLVDGRYRTTSPPGSPGLNFSLAAGALDPNTDDLVFYRVEGPDPGTSQTWTYDGNLDAGFVDEMLDAGNQPPPTWYGGAAYDEVLEAVVFWGGQNTQFATIEADFRTETWIYQSGSWSLLDTAGTTPPGRRTFSMVTSPAGRASVVGGFTDTAAGLVTRTDCWELIDNVWVEGGCVAARAGVEVAARNSIMDLTVAGAQPPIGRVSELTDLSQQETVLPARALGGAFIGLVATSSYDPTTRRTYVLGNGLWILEDHTPERPTQVLEVDFSSASAPDPQLCLDEAQCPVDQVEIRWVATSAADAEAFLATAISTPAPVEAVTLFTASGPSVLALDADGRAVLDADDIPTIGRSFLGANRRFAIAASSAQENGPAEVAGLYTEHVEVRVRYRQPAP